MHQNFCTTVLQLNFDGFEGLSESESAWCKNNSYCTALTKPRNAARSPGDPVAGLPYTARLCRADPISRPK